MLRQWHFRLIPSERSLEAVGESGYTLDIKMKQSSHVETICVAD